MPARHIAVRAGAAQNGYAATPRATTLAT